MSDRGYDASLAVITAARADSRTIHQARTVIVQAL